MTYLFDKTRTFVSENFNGNVAQMKHFDRTVDWLKQLKPEADEAMFIAAIGHDIERGFQDKSQGFGDTEKRFTDSEELARHADTGAKILGEFLKKEGASDEIVNRVKHLVYKHEVGGDEDQNFLKNADSLSFLENNAQIFLSRINELGYEKIKEKFDWMYNRISGHQAKEIAQPYYKKIIRLLNDRKS